MLMTLHLRCTQELEAQWAASSKSYADAVADAEHFTTELAATQAAAAQPEREHHAALACLQVGRYTSMPTSTSPTGTFNPHSLAAVSWLQPHICWRIPTLLHLRGNNILQDEVATQKAAVEALQDKRQLEAAAAEAALRRSEAEARDAAQRCAAVEAAAQDEAQVLQSQVGIRVIRRHTSCSIHTICSNAQPAIRSCCHE